jgi:hypothetical protein
MSQLIDLTIYSRNSNVLTTPTVYGFDVEDIVTPILLNNAGRATFSARMLKGSDVQNRNLAKVIYEATEALNAIASKSPFIVKLTVLKRRGVDIASIEYIFVASRISENITPTVGGGSKFFYNEDGDTLPVEYEVLEDVATIVAATTVASSAVPTPLTWVQAQAIRNAGLLNPADGFKVGSFYHITDAALPFASEGIVVQAITETELSVNGDGIFLNPDYQTAGDYSGVPGFNAQQGVWRSTLEAGMVDGDVVIHNGLHYVVSDATAFAGTNPALTPLAYTQLSKIDTNGYIREVDIVYYDFNNDVVIRRFDKRGNDVSAQGLYLFQWGSDTKLRNIINTAGVLDCLNALQVTIAHNLVSNQCYVNANIDTSTLSRCNFSANMSVNLEASGINYVNKELTSGYSNFESDLDFSDNTIWDAPTNTLTMPSNFEFVGIFNIVNADALNDVEVITNFTQTNHKIRFNVEDGSTQGFSHTAIGVAVADNLVSDAAAVNTITGRTNGSDFIEYERAGNLNRRYNLVVLA